MSRQRAILYLRQSDSGGSGDDSVSIHSQETILRDLAARHGDIVVRVEVDTDFRGWQDDTERDGLRAVLAAARASEMDVVYVYDLSRLARKLKLQEDVYDRLSACGVTVRSYREPFADHPMFRQIIGAIGEERTREMSAHGRRSVAERARRGIHHGLTPYGYSRPSRNAALVPDAARPERVQAVRLLFERFVGGDTMIAICAEINRRRYPPARSDRWSLESIRKILQNPAYAGHVSLHGEIVARDAHPALVSAETWLLAQERLADRNRPRPRRKDSWSWLEGLIFHECGSRLYLIAERDQFRFRCGSAFRQKMRGLPPPTCYRRPMSILQPAAEEQTWSQLCDDLARLIDADAAIAEARRLYRERVPDAAQRRADLSRRLAALDDQLRRAEDLYIGGTRDRDWLRERETKLAADRIAITAELDRLPPEPDESAIRFAEQVLRDLSGLLPRMPHDRNRTIILARLGAAFLVDGRMELRYYAPFATLLGTDRVFDQRLHIAQQERATFARFTLLLLRQAA